MGNAGTAMRLFTGLLAAQRFSSRLIGDASLMKRPMERVAKPLREMGADVRTHDGHAAGVTSAAAGALHGIDYTMPVASAQVKSAILLAGLYADGPTTVIAPAVSPRSQRAHAARLRRARWTRRACASSVHPAEAALRAFSARRARVIFVGSVFHRGRSCWARRRDGLLIQQCRHESDAHRTCSTFCARMGATIEVRSMRGESGAEPVADLRAALRACKGIDRAASPWCRSPSTSFRCCSWPLPAPTARRWSRAPRSCG